MKKESLFSEIKAGGTIYKYLEWGEKDNKALICLHGYADDASMFSELGEYFAHRSRVIALNFPMADSNNKSYCLASLTDYALNFIKAMKMDEYDIFGFSLGGLVAINVASADGKKTKVLVSNMCPTVLLNRHEKLIYKVIRPILVTKVFCFLFSRIRILFAKHDKGQTRDISGALGRIKSNYYSVFSTLFNFASVDLTYLFNHTPDIKHLFIFKDDKVIRYFRYKRSINLLRCQKYLFERGGHMATQDYWKLMIEKIKDII